MNRFVILDENGVMLNRIATDATEIPYAGYGCHITYEGDGDAPVVSVEAPWVYLSVKPSMPMCQGDTMNIETGEVTRYVPPPEPVVDEVAP